MGRKDINVGRNRKGKWSDTITVLSGKGCEGTDRHLLYCTIILADLPCEQIY